MPMPRKDWPATEHLPLLFAEISEAAQRLTVSFVDSEGIERAVVDNGCYYEMFRFHPVCLCLKASGGPCVGHWQADSIDDAERWPSDASDAYGEACLHLGELGERMLELGLIPVEACMGCSSELRHGSCPNMACRWGRSS